MCVLIYIDTNEGRIRKASLEALSYGARLAVQLGTTAEGLVLGKVDEDLTALGAYGVKTIHHAGNASLATFDSQVYARVVSTVAEDRKATAIIFSHNTTAKSIAPRVSVRLKAGLVTGAIDLPDTSNGFVVKKSVFSAKAFSWVSVHTPVKIIALTPNSFGLHPGEGTAAVVPVAVADMSTKVTVTGSEKVTGQVPLSDAELVVSGGRGLKGPEHWGMIEELAKLLGAATACSRPVADAHWRPHYEHVGQTGGTIAPNLYIAVGISGAIQHLAGVNRSKVIVVINKDPEAPFFKAADYGIVGDAFEVMPRILAAVRKLKTA